MNPACHRIKLLIAVYLFLFGLNPLVWAQNLAPNPEFEVYNICPDGYNVPTYPTFNCYPWRSGSAGTPDYFNACSNPNDVGVPDNYFGWQPALSGEGYTGFFLVNTDNGEYREYIQANLESPLIGGKSYLVSFNVSLASRIDCGIENIGAYFSAENPGYDGFNPILVNPQVESAGEFYSDTMNWMLIEGCFTAVGDEEVITIGNFHDNAGTNFDPDCISDSRSYYYLEDVYVGEVVPGGLDIELGGPVSGCDSYTIDPGMNGVDYYWEDGSTGPTLTVSTSGTYSLTIYDECLAGVDSIEVEIINSIPIELDPDEVTICQGETFEVILDPEAGEYTWNDGSHASTYIISTAGIYAVTLDDGCELSSDQIEVTVLNPPAPFSLGGDTVLCTGSQIEITLDPSLGDFHWQNNSNSNSFIITQAGIYSVTISNMCGEVSAELEVTEIAGVVADLGPDFDTLCTGEVLDIILDPTLGTYVWQDGSTSTTYQISTGGVYSVTMTNDCGQSSDSITVISLQTPSFDLGDTIYQCSGDSLAIAISNWIGEYAWSTGSDTNFIIVYTSGTYSLTITNTCGIDSGDIVIIYGDSLLPPSLGPDFSLCPGDVAILDVSQPDATYLWQDMSTADTLVINGAGTYHVTVSNGCEALSDTIEVTVESIPPMIIMPDMLSLCEGNSVVLDPGVDGVTYDWSDGTHLSTLLIDMAGQYSLTVTNSCGIDIDTVTILDGGHGPFVSLGPDTFLCPGEILNLDPVSSNITSWLWSDGSIDSSFTTSIGGVVYVEATNGCGVSYDTLLVTLHPLTPSLSLGPDIVLCPGTTINVFVLEPDVDILWPDGSTENHFLVSDTMTQLYATITNGCGESSDTVGVSLLPGVPPLDLGPDQSLCIGEVIMFSPGITGVNYLWHDGSTGTSFQTTQPSTVILTISNVCGTAKDTVVITEDTNGPQVDLGPDVLGCEGETITIPSGITGVSYLWHDGSTRDEFIATTTGWVHLTINNLCGTDIDSVFVNLSGVAPAPDLGADTTLCEGISLLLVSNADTSTLVEWQDGSVLPDFLVTTAGTYTLTETNQCGSATDEIVVSFMPLPPVVDLGPDTSLCPGESFVLMAPQTTNALRWQDGSSGTTMVVELEQTYSLQISNNCGVTSDSLLVNINADIPQLNLSATIPLCPGEEISLDAQQSFLATYLWNNGQADPVITVSTPGIYSVEVYTPCATATGLVEVTAMEDCDGMIDVFIPNVFSPNDDQVNDKFILSFDGDQQVIAIEGSIFDRWGNLVFSSTKDPFEWDGRFKDQKVMPGVYVYLIKLTYIFDGEEREEVFAGDVTVLR